MGTASRLPAFCSVSAVDAVVVPTLAKLDVDQAVNTRAFAQSTGPNRRNASGLRRGALPLPLLPGPVARHAGLDLVAGVRVDHLRVGGAVVAEELGEIHLGAGLVG